MKITWYITELVIVPYEPYFIDDLTAKGDKVTRVAGKAEYKGNKYGTWVLVTGHKIGKNAIKDAKGLVHIKITRAIEAVDRGLDK